MNQTRNDNRQGSYRRTTGAAVRNRNAYVYGNTVRKPQVQQRTQEQPTRQLQPVVRKNREKAHHMSMGYVLFLATALIAAGLILVNYIQLQAELTNMTKSNAGLERTLNNMRLTNDEEYNRIMSSIDLEEIKRIAIGELGMIYAQEGQIYTYTNESNDYMRQVTADTN